MCKGCGSMYPLSRGDDLLYLGYLTGEGDLTGEGEFVLSSGVGDLTGEGDNNGDDEDDDDSGQDECNVDW